MALLSTPILCAAWEIPYFVISKTVYMSLFHIHGVNCDALHFPIYVGSVCVASISRVNEYSVRGCHNLNDITAPCYEESHKNMVWS